MGLPDFLRALREARGMSVPDVVERLGVPRATAYSWEQARGNPEPENLGRLLDLYAATAEQRLEAWRLRSESRDEAERAA